ncbi:sigma 54-interacting transcriptional regulator [Myxococcota bacterium]|nr:sigma 54-interacting transcriptional regulator [Myxococcota bacterium]
MAVRDQTLSLTHDGRRRGADAGEPHLFLVLDADRPLAPPARFSLAGIDEVILGRGEPLTPTITTEAGNKRLDLRVPDRRMSSQHARLSRVLDGWMLEDTRSKNGTFVRGEKKTRVELADGDVIELGRTFFLFRRSLPTARTPAQDVDTSPIRTLIPRFAADLELLAEVSRSAIPVLLRGETGTGKEVAARLVHRLSQRPGDFIPVTCGVLPESMIELELLGAERGAVPGAPEGRPGLVKNADRGTLFLDELGDFCGPIQPALLRVLQEKEVYAIGSGRPTNVDIRVVASTNQDVEQLVARGKLRRDLLTRVEGFTFVLPPLRDRREDLGLLVASLLERHAGARAPEVRFAPEVVRALFEHSWPGNVRELERCLSTALVLAKGGTIEPEHLSKLLVPEPVPTLRDAPEPATEPATPAAPAAPKEPAPAAPRGPESRLPVLAQDGDLWKLTYEGQTTHVADAHGLHYIQYLLERPGEEVHVLDLMNVVRKDEPRARETGGVGPALDAEAKRAYRRRIEELRAELEEATEWNDPARIERASAELEALTEELARGVGLGGRDRTAGTASERARANLTARIRKVIKRIEELHPALGHHLSTCIRTGTFCVYVPPPPT